jgi:hypothetical protein
MADGTAEVTEITVDMAADMLEAILLKSVGLSAYNIAFNLYERLGAECPSNIMSVACNKLIREGKAQIKIRFIGYREYEGMITLVRADH